MFSTTPKSHGPLSIALVIIGFAAIAGGAYLYLRMNHQTTPIITNTTNTTNATNTTASTKEVQYLLFQYSANLFKEAPDFKGTSFDSADLGRFMGNLLTSLNNNSGDGKARQLGFAVGPLSLDQTDTEMRTVIQQSFKVAEEKNLAVAFHIDDSMFWIKCTDLWKNFSRAGFRGFLYPNTTKLQRIEEGMQLST